MIHRSIDDVYLLSLNEINRISDKSLKKQLLTLYNEEIKKITNDPIGRLFISEDKSIEQIYFEIERYTYSLRSEYLFYNDIVRFYPFIKETVASKNITCHFCGSVISKGSLYLSYRPFLQNMSTGKKYVLQKTIKTEIGYREYLPTTLKEFEQFIYNLDNAYIQDRNTCLDYYSINSNLGNWSLLELKERRKQLKKIK